MAAKDDKRALILEQAELWPGMVDNKLAEAIDLTPAKAVKLYAELVETGELDLRDQRLHRLTPAAVRKLDFDHPSAFAYIYLPEDAPLYEDIDASGDPPSNHHARCMRCGDWIEPSGMKLLSPFLTYPDHFCAECDLVVSERNMKRAQKALPLFLEGRDLAADLEGSDGDGWPEFEKYLEKARLLADDEAMWWIEPKTSRRWRLELDALSNDYSRGTQLDLIKGKGGRWSVKQVPHDAS